MAAMRRAALAALLLLARPAAAEPPTAPPRPAPGGLTLAPGAWFVQVNIEANLSVDNALEPVSVAPDVSYGVTSSFTLGLIHSSAALTGFRGTSGDGLCVTGTRHGCAHAYTDGGVDGLFSLSRGTLATAAEVGLLWTRTDPLALDLKVGLRTKLTSGWFSLVASPSVWLPVRDPNDPTVPHDAQLWVPVAAWFRTSPAFSLGLSSGIKGPTGKFSDGYSIPLGVLGQYTFDRHFALGSSLVFGKVFGGGAVMGTGLDARALQVWLSFQ